MKKFSMTLACLLAGTIAAQAETLKVGVLGPLSGGGAGWGIAMRGGAELAAEEINAAGGLKVGDTTYQIEVVAYDDQYKASEAVNAMNRMIFDDEIKVVYGPLGSAGLVALLPTTTENKVITVSAAFAHQAVAPESPFSYRAVLPTGIFSKPQIDWVVKTLGAKKVGGIFPNDESGQVIAAEVEAAYVGAGAEFASKEFFERERIDFVPLLTRVLATGIDTFELDGNAPQTAGLIVKQLRELGFKGNIIRTGGDGTNEILAVAGNEGSAGIYVHQLYDPSNAAIKEFRTKFEAKYNQPMNAFSPFFYIMSKVIYQAMQDTGTVDDTEALTKRMAELKGYETAFGVVDWYGQEIYGADRQLYVPYFIAKITGEGGLEVVANCDTEACK